MVYTISIEFSYDLDGNRHYIKPPFSTQQHVILAGERTSIPVRCELRPNAGGTLPPNLDMVVKPYWAPRGASQFLELIRQKYYDGVAFNRVVPNFLIQFGIAKDYAIRTEWDVKTILDDDVPTERIQFKPGYVSFAGSGPNSRTTEIFVAMPYTDQAQLDYFGENSWEVPFAVVENVKILNEIYSYGDMPPWGEGKKNEKVDGFFLSVHIVCLIALFCSIYCLSYRSRFTTYI